MDGFVGVDVRFWSIRRIWQAVRSHPMTKNTLTENKLTTAPQGDVKIFLLLQIYSRSRLPVTLLSDR